MSDTLLEEIGQFAELGGILLDIEQKFRNADFTETLTDFLPQIEQEQRSVFVGERSPGGEDWPPLAASTIARKGHSKKLVESGALMASMVDRNAAHHVGEVLPLGLSYGTDLEYAGFQNFGTQRIPQREFSGMSEETADLLAGRVADDLVGKLRYTVRG